jgi:hypothetical protein
MESLTDPVEHRYTMNDRFAESASLAAGSGKARFIVALASARMIRFGAER